MSKPQVIVLTKDYVGYYGYFYPKELIEKNGKTLPTLKKLSKKFPDLEFYDKRVLNDKQYKGILIIENSLSGAKPMLDAIDIYDYHKYDVVNVKEVLREANRKRSD